MTKFDEFTLSFLKSKYTECTLSFLTDYIDLYADESKPSFSSVSMYQAMNFRCYFRGIYTETKEKLLINTKRMADFIYTFGQNGGKISAFFAVGGKDGDLVFIRPFEKRTYYAMAMSVRLSVRPSVRVFRTFFQHALRYQFETWYMHSVGGTACRVWVSSQLGHFDLVYSQK